MLVTVYLTNDLVSGFDLVDDDDDEDDPDAVNDPLYQIELQVSSRPNIQYKICLNKIEFVQL